MKYKKEFETWLDTWPMGNPEDYNITREAMARAWAECEKVLMRDMRDWMDIKFDHYDKVERIPIDKRILDVNPEILNEERRRAGNILKKQLGFPTDDEIKANSEPYLKGFFIDENLDNFDESVITEKLEMKGHLYCAPPKEKEHDNK